jgi:hypothetical protein
MENLIAARETRELALFRRRKIGERNAGQLFSTFSCAPLQLARIPTVQLLLADAGQAGISVCEGYFREERKFG